MTKEVTRTAGREPRPRDSSREIPRMRVSRTSAYSTAGAHAQTTSPGSRLPTVQSRRGSTRAARVAFNHATFIAVSIIACARGASAAPFARVGIHPAGGELVVVLVEAQVETVTAIQHEGGDERPRPEALVLEDERERRVGDVEGRRAVDPEAVRDRIGAAVSHVEPQYAPTRLGDVRSSLASIEKARTLLNYDPQIAFEQGVERTVDWYGTRVGLSE